MNIKDHFRHPSFRKGQEELLEQIEDALDNDYRYIMIEAPTGLGKSDISMAIAQCLTKRNKLTKEEIKDIENGKFEEKEEDEGIEQAYIVTSQIPLQQQYKKDFFKRGHFYDIRGKANYECLSPRNKEASTCADNWQECSHKSSMSCPYRYEKQMSKLHPITSMNYSFFVMGTRGWKKRNVALLDECHNIPKIVMNMTSFTLSNGALKKLGVTRPHFRKISDMEWDQNLVEFDEFYDWAEELFPTLEKKKQDLEAKKKLTNQDIKNIENLNSLIFRVQRFLKNAKNQKWVVQPQKIKTPKGEFSLKAEPIDSGDHAKDLIFDKAEKYIFLSATIGDFTILINDLGLEEDEVCTIRVPSPFDLLNRPIYGLDTTPMDRQSLTKDTDALEKLVNQIKIILKAFPNHKGIIHSHTKNIQNYLYKRLDDKRLISPEKASDREKALSKHKKSKRPTVLLSPSMTEGVDLPGELAEFTIICKIPYPYLGDQRIKIKAEINPDWYQYQAIQTLIQSAGRGVRREDDHCYTFVLDSAFENFVKRNFKLISPDFTKAIRPRKEAFMMFEKSINGEIEL